MERYVSEGKSTPHAEKVAANFAAKQELKDIIAAQNFPAKETLNWKTVADPYIISSKDSKGILQILKDNLTGSKLSDQNYVGISYSHMFKHVQKYNTTGQSSKRFDLNVIEPGDKIHVDKGTLYVNRKPGSKYAAFSAPIYPWDTAPAPAPAEPTPPAAAEPVPEPAPTPAAPEAAETVAPTETLPEVNADQLAAINQILADAGTKFTVEKGATPQEVTVKHANGRTIKVVYDTDPSLPGWRGENMNEPAADLLTAVKEAITQMNSDDTRAYIREHYKGIPKDDDGPAFYREGASIYFNDASTFGRDEKVWEDKLNVYDDNIKDYVLRTFNEIYNEVNPAPTPAEPTPPAAAEPVPEPAPAAPTPTPAIPAAPEAAQAAPSEIETAVQNWNSTHPNANVKSMILADGESYPEGFKTMLAPYGKIETNLTKAKEAGVAIENTNFVIFPGSAPADGNYSYEKNGQKYVIIYSNASYSTNTKGIQGAIENQ